MRGQNQCVSHAQYRSTRTHRCTKTRQSSPARGNMTTTHLWPSRPTPCSPTLSSDDHPTPTPRHRSSPNQRQRPQRQSQQLPPLLRRHQSRHLFPRNPRPRLLQPRGAIRGRHQPRPRSCVCQRHFHSHADGQVTPQRTSTRTSRRSLAASEAAAAQAQLEAEAAAAEAPKEAEKPADAMDVDE